MIRKGQSWERPAPRAEGAPTALDDPGLAAAAATDPRTRVRPGPGSDLARALGLGRGPVGGLEVTVDVVRVDGLEGVELAVNAIVVGTPPDRLWWGTRRARVELTVDGHVRYAGSATTIVVANGQYLRGTDVVPRGHPGDGRIEVQVYALGRGERRAMRRRLANGAHLPHPRIRTWSGRRVLVRCRPTLPVEADGVARGRARELVLEVVPGALRVLV